MRILITLLLAADLLLGAWIAWGPPQDGTHEPARIEHQVDPQRLRVLGEEEFQKARQRSQEAAEAAAAATAAAVAAHPQETAKKK